MSSRMAGLAASVLLCFDLLTTAACEVGMPGEPELPPGTRNGWYVRTTGTSDGNGSDSLPWDLRTALDGADGRIAPGDTVWIRGGTYTGSFTTTLAGIATAPILVRAYPNEQAIIDGNGSGNPTFVVDGRWAIYWGLEITNSMSIRSGSGLGVRPTGVYVRNANDVKLIDFIVHETGHGTYTEPDAGNIEIYGWVVYNGGHQIPGGRSDGHGLYVKNYNTAGVKTFRDNVVFNMFAFGVHGYTEAGSGRLENMVFEGNVIFNNGVISTDYNPNFQIGGNNLADRDTARNNLLFFSPGVAADYNMRIGYASYVNGQTQIRENYVVGGSPVIEVAYWTDLDVVNNTFVGGSLVTRLFDTSPGDQHWAGNTYYRDPGVGAWRYGGTTYTFGGWQAATGLSATDGATAGLPSAPYVLVRPHQYQEGAALVAIVNWTDQASVPVSLSGVLVAGEQFEVRNVQALFRAPVLTATYSGLVDFPMNGVDPPPVVGGSPNPPPRTGPRFDVFVVRRLAP